MLDMNKWIKEVYSNEKISNKNLEILLNNFFTKKDNSKKIFGAGIKLSLEHFFDFIDKNITSKNKFVFDISKGKINDILKKDYNIKMIDSGSYENEFFYMTGVDVEYYNKKIVSTLSKISNYNYEDSVPLLTNKDFLNELSGKKVNLFTIYKKLENKFKDKDKIIQIIFKTIHENGLEQYIEVSKEELLFARYNPLELFNSWYISDMLIDEDIVNNLF